MGCCQELKQEARRSRVSAVNCSEMIGEWLKWIGSPERGSPEPYAGSVAVIPVTDLRLADAYVTACSLRKSGWQWAIEVWTWCEEDEDDALARLIEKDAKAINVQAHTRAEELIDGWRLLGAALMHNFARKVFALEPGTIASAEAVAQMNNFDRGLALVPDDGDYAEPPYMRRDWRARLQGKLPPATWHPRAMPVFLDRVANWEVGALTVYMNQHAELFSQACRNPADLWMLASYICRRDPDWIESFKWGDEDDVIEVREALKEKWLPGDYYHPERRRAAVASRAMEGRTYTAFYGQEQHRIRFDRRRIVVGMPGCDRYWVHGSSLVLGLGQVEVMRLAFGGNGILAGHDWMLMPLDIGKKTNVLALPGNPIPPAQPRTQHHHKPRDLRNTQGQRVLIKMPYALGDAVHVSTALRLAKPIMPHWDQVDVQCHDDLAWCFQGVAANAGLTMPLESYDYVQRIGNMHPQGNERYVPCATIVNCLRQFNIPWEAIRPEDYVYKLHVDEAERQRVQAILVEKYGSKPRFVCIHNQPRSFADNKLLAAVELERILETCRELDAHPLLLDWSDESTSDFPKKHPIWGEGHRRPPYFAADSRSLGAVLSLASAVIGLDSGPAHVAGGVGAPLIVYWKKHHPVNFFCFNANAVHVIPDDDEPNIIAAEMSRPDHAAFAREHFRLSRYLPGHAATVICHELKLLLE